MYYYMYITYCCILTIFVCTTDADNICPSRTILVSTSGTIKSPDYPENYKTEHDCTLNLLVPSLTNIEFTVNGEYDVHDYQGKCEDNNDHFRLVTPDGTPDGKITQLCGTRADNQVLGSYYNDGESQATVTLQFKAAGSVTRDHIFQIEYTVFTTTTTSTTTTSTTTTSTTTTSTTATSTTTTTTGTHTTTTPKTSTPAVLSTIISSTTITAISHADSTASTDVTSSQHFTTSSNAAMTAVTAAADNLSLPEDSLQTFNTLTRNMLIGSGVALVTIIVVIVAAVMFRRRQQQSKDNSMALNTIATQQTDCTDNHSTNSDGNIESGGASNYILAEPVLATNGQTDRGGDNSTTRGTGSTSNYMLAEPFGSDEGRTDDITTNISDYILAGPCDEYANVDVINRVQKEREMKDVYVDIPAHLTTSKTVEPSMVDNELYGT